MNDRLSQARADKAAAFLVSKGIPAARVIAVGRGPREPLPNLAPTDQANRRVQVRRLNPPSDQAG